jgi:hypothetical protein
MNQKEIESGDLVRVKADATGVDVSVSKAVPGVISRLFPPRFRLRRAVDETLGNQIVAKIEQGKTLDEAEFAFAETALSDSAKKFVRLKRIETRADELKALPPMISPPNDNSGSSPRSTSDDWINRFREDASLVDDELLRELYAKVLREEDGHPRSFALRTLGVLRYLDREVAESFGRLQKVVIDNSFVPAQSPNKDHILNRVGVSHSMMLALGDAGLVNAAAQSRRTYESEQILFSVGGHGKVLAVRRKDGSKFTVSLEIHLLAPAGCELAQIAEFTEDNDAFAWLVKWLRPQLGGADLFVASLPSRNWTGPVAQLTWKEL